MKSRPLVVLTLLGLAAIAALSAAAAPKPPNATSWEYATYRSLGNRYQWQSPDEDIFARDLGSFINQFKLKGHIRDDTAELELMNHFGQQGWELIQMTPPGETRGTWIFWFKRPKSR